LSAFVIYSFPTAGDVRAEALPRQPGLYFVHAVLDFCLVCSEGEHVAAEHVYFADELVGESFDIADAFFDRYDFFFDFEDFGEGAFPDGFGFEGAALGLVFKGLKTGVDGLKFGKEPFFE
jgi:hypothetical protein